MYYIDSVILCVDILAFLTTIVWEQCPRPHLKGYAMKIPMAVW